MKFFNSLGPNPKVVRMFMAEKGITIPLHEVEIMAGENRQDAHLKRNPHGQMPALELDNGAFLSEVTAICEYLEDRESETCPDRHDARRKSRNADVDPPDRSQHL